MTRPISNPNKPGVYRRLASYILPHWPVMLVGLFATVLFSGVDAGATYAIKPLINKGFVDKDLAFIQWIPLVILGAFIIRGVTNFLSSYCMAWVARSVVMKLRREMFRHLLRLPATYYDRVSSGAIISKLVYDVEQVSQLSMESLTLFVQSLCIVIGLGTVMFIISWRLTLLFSVSAPLIIWVVRWTNKRVRRVSLKTQGIMGRVTEVVEESVTAHREVRIFGGQAHEDGKFLHATAENRAFDMKVVATRATSVSSVQIIAACGIAFVVHLAIDPQYSTALSAGGFASLIAAMLALLKPLKNLTRVNSDIQRGLAGAESIFHLLDEPAEIDNGQQLLPHCQGLIQYQQVNFAYQQNNQTVLNDIQLTLQAGQTLALVGRSGSGKSTLVSLLCRFYELNTGIITIDGIDISQLKLSELRRHIAIVSQHVTLFNASIASNIAYGLQREVSDELIEAAARSAHAMEFIERLPQGLQTRIGENGVLLSGGQRQRIAIARAILKNAPILILDEATSALDTESERHIQAALTEVMKNRTTLVIAHRLSTIENADRIVVLEAGKIVESGTHQQLMAQSGYYAKLQAMQYATRQVVATVDEPLVNTSIAG